MNLRSLFGWFSSDAAVDLGTANTLVYVQDRGIVVNEPSIVVINRADGAIETVGAEAKQMVGRTPPTLLAVQPVRNGVIADFNVAERMLAYFIRKAHQHRRLVHPRVAIAVPADITQVEKRAVVDAASQAKASEVYLVDQAIAAAIGAGLPIAEPSGNMVVDVGGGTTNVAIVSLSGIVYSSTLRVGGATMDERIVHHVRSRHNLLIGESTAEAVKIAIGSAHPLEKRQTMEITGRDLVQGVPRTITVNDDEIRQALADLVDTILNSIRVALEVTPPELSADLCDRGILLTGGGSLLQKLDERIRKETGLPVTIADEPLAAVVLGTGKMFHNLELLRKLAIE